MEEAESWHDLDLAAIKQVQADMVWPNRKHTLHAPATDYWAFSHIGWQRHENMHGRVSGFRKASEVLYQSMIAEKSIATLDTVFFPYAACWRHCIELQLKALLATLRALANVPPATELHHKLGSLWQETSSLIAAHLSEDDDLENAGRVIAQLSGLDPDSQAFRYSTDRRGNPTLPNLEKVNLPEFHKAMTGVANYLEAAEDMASEHLSMKQDMDAYTPPSSAKRGIELLILRGWQHPVLN